MDITTGYASEKSGHKHNDEAQTDYSAERKAAIFFFHLFLLTYILSTMQHKENSYSSFCSTFTH